MLLINNTLITTLTKRERTWWKSIAFFALKQKSKQDQIHNSNKQHISKILYAINFKNKVKFQDCSMSAVIPGHVKSNYGSHRCKSSHHCAILLELKEADQQGLGMEVKNYGYHLRAMQKQAELHNYQILLQTSWSSKEVPAVELHCQLIQYSSFVLVLLGPWQNNVNKSGEKLQALQLLALLLPPLVARTFCTFLLMHNCCQCNLLIHFHTHPTHNAAGEKGSQEYAHHAVHPIPKYTYKKHKRLNLIDSKF